jgi:hypothetical protein
MDLGASGLASFLSTRSVPDSRWAREISRSTARTTFMTAATAFYARRTAHAVQIAAESSIRQEAQLAQLTNLVVGQLANIEARLEAQQDQNREMLEVQHQMLRTQQQTSWMHYRQSPDGREFMDWGRRAAVLLDRFDSVNTEWLTAFRTVVAQTIPRAEWEAEETGDYLPPTHKSKAGSTGFMVKMLKSYDKFMDVDDQSTEDGDRPGARDDDSQPPAPRPESLAKILTPQKKWQAENEAIRAGFHQRRMAYFGCDPIIDPDALPPGWARDDLNWLIPAMIRSFMEYAYGNYPAPDELPEILDWPPARPAHEVRPPELVPVVTAWLQRGTVNLSG